MTFQKIPELARYVLFALGVSLAASSMSQTATPPARTPVAAPLGASSAPSGAASGPQMLEGLDVAKERARIAAARKESDAQLLAQEKLCYQKFAVTPCLEEARAKQRVVTSDLRRQEIALNDAERRRKGAEQMRQIDERLSPEAQRLAADKRAQAVIDEQNRRDAAAGKLTDKAARATTDADRARQQQQKIESRDRALADREAKAANTAANVQALEARQKSAADHKAKREAQLKEKASNGKQVAPLPDPSKPGPSD